MTDDLRWAVRYTFLEDLWRDRARVVVDSSLEASLRAGGAALKPQSPLGELVDALVPRDRGARTWMGVADEAAARELTQTRPGSGFLPRSTVADVVAHRDWAVALVELAALDPEQPGGSALRRQLAAGAEQGRTVIVAAAAAASDNGDDDPAYGALVDLLDDELSGGRVYGIYRPPMAGVIDFGEGDEDDDDEVALSFDNTLGSQAPSFVEYVAIVGAAPELPTGMTLVELPPHAAGAAAAGSGGDDGLRAKLASAQRRAELAAIDRQALLEQVDALESSNSQLSSQSQSLREKLARLVNEEPAGSPEHEQRLQAALADAQALRWKTQQLERELSQLRARPVEELEAEVAELRARLAASEPSEVEVEPSPGSESDPRDEASAELDEIYVDEDDDGDDWESAVVDPSMMFMLAEADERADRMRRGEAGRDLDRLIARVERGGIDALALRQALVSLRRRIRP